jgi:NADH-quinone oxidoreductase subunit N
LPKVAALGLFAKILYHGFVDLSEQWIQIILIISIASMFVGSLAAIMQTNIKRMLAYSSIGHVGFILVGLVSGEEQGLKGFMIYLMIYLTMTVGIFAAILMLRSAGKPVEEIKQLAGLSKTHPYLAFAISILMFSLAGVPPFAGFFAKFYILMAAIDQGAYYYAVLVVTASVIAAFYYLRIVKIMYMDESSQSIELSSPFSIKAILATSATFNLLYVIMPAPIIIIAERAAISIFG